jgi:uncharacterized protein YcbK (DUF882 family)
MASSPDGIIAPELRRLRKLLSRKRHEPIRIIVTTDPTRPVRTLTIPRFLPVAFVGMLVMLLLIAMVLSFSTWTMSGTINLLKHRVMAMMQLADGVAMSPEGVAHASMFGNRNDASVHLRKPSGEKGHFVIESANNGEQIRMTFDLATGDMDADSYLAFRHLMRCRRTGAEVPIDPRLIELLWRISHRTGQKILLISGYRAPAYAAPASYHVRGMAADIRVPGMTALMVRDLARALGAHGIGYYPRSQFVHVDVREEPYYWTDLGPERSDSETEYEGGKVEPTMESRLIAAP